LETDSGVANKTAIRIKNELAITIEDSSEVLSVARLVFDPHE